MAQVKAKPAGGALSYNDGITDGDDQIIGSSNQDIIWAHGGDDFLKGGGGADYLDGGSGRDAASYAESTQGVQVNLQTGYGHGGEAEGDILVRIEDLYGSNFDDTLIGDQNDNRLDGGKGNDILKGGGGIDTLIGGDGDDVLEIDSFHDQVEGGAGSDTLMFRSDYGVDINLGAGVVMSINGYHSHHYRSTIEGVENVLGTQYDDWIIGSDVANKLSGGSGADTLSGKGGNDQIDGENGADTIIGGTGADVLRGGAGADVFVFTSLFDSYVIAGKPMDRITDFQQGVDKIDLTEMDLAYGDLMKVNNQTIDGVNYTYVGVDANHNGSLDIAEFAVAVKMPAGATLNANDFLF